MGVSACARIGVSARARIGVSACKARSVRFRVGLPPRGWRSKRDLASRSLTALGKGWISA
jgi:hypothetical protein